MATGGSSSSTTGHDSEATIKKITPIVVVSCIMAATGGLMFGYDIGATGFFFLFISILNFSGRSI